MKLIYFAIVSLLVSSSSIAQLNKKNCVTDFKLKPHSCGFLIKNIDAKSYQKKWNETIFELNQKLAKISSPKKKFEIKIDTLQITEKIRVKGKTHYNILKFPLKKLVNISFEFKELVIYTKWKEIQVERYKYKKLKTSQITILKEVINKENTKLYELFEKIIACNRFRNAIHDNKK